MFDKLQTKTNTLYLPKARQQKPKQIGDPNILTKKERKKKKVTQNDSELTRDHSWLSHVANSSVAISYVLELRKQRRG